MTENMFTGVDHVGLAAQDVEKLTEWYCQVLGYEKVHYHEKGVWMIRAQDGTMIEVMPCDDTKRPERTTWTPGWSHLVLRVADMEKACAYLESKGVEFANEIINAIGGGKVRNFYDPEGNMLQIAWRESK
ncbi:MAG: VOC family protein [Limnochordia bacterium]|jgi:glyoxylase I family protein|nr:VOC family protein [Bacillota bacterium]